MRRRGRPIRKYPGEKAYKDATMKLSLALALIISYFLITKVDILGSLPNANGLMQWLDSTFSLGASSIFGFLVVMIPAFAFFALWIAIGVSIRVIVWQVYLKRKYGFEAKLDFTDTTPTATTQITTQTGTRSKSRVKGKAFECEVADIIEMETNYIAEVVGGSGDGGVDIRVCDQTGRLVGIVQCKEYSPNQALAPIYIRELKAVKDFHGVQIAYLVTTARFSADSRKVAKEYGVRLMDGETYKTLKKKLAQKRNPAETK